MHPGCWWHRFWSPLEKTMRWCLGSTVPATSLLLLYLCLDILGLKWRHFTALLYTVLYSKIQNPQPLVENALMWQCTTNSWTNSHDQICQHTFASLKVWNWNVCFGGTYCIYAQASQVGLVAKNLPASAGDIRDAGSNPGWGRFPWRRKWQPTPVFLPGQSQGQRRLEGYIQSIESQRVRHDWSNLACMHCICPSLHTCPSFQWMDISAPSFLWLGRR